MRLGDQAPDFSAWTSLSLQEPLQFYSWLGNSWCMLFSHPADFTPVCTTELGEVSRLYDEFARRNCKVVALSTDDVERHREWIKDINETQGVEVQYPIISDSDRAVSKLYGMLDNAVHDPRNVDASGMPHTVRSVFVIDPSKRIRLTITYPATVGRSFSEILRTLEALQLGDRYQIATPVNWRIGDEVIIRPSVSDEEAHRQFGTFRMVKPYIRYARVE